MRSMSGTVLTNGISFQPSRSIVLLPSWKPWPRRAILVTACVIVLSMIALCLELKMSRLRRSYWEFEISPWIGVSISAAAKKSRHCIWSRYRNRWTTSTKSNLRKRNLEFRLRTDSRERKFCASFVAMNTLLRERNVLRGAKCVSGVRKESFCQRVQRCRG